MREDFKKAESLKQQKNQFIFPNKTLKILPSQDREEIDITVVVK